MEQGALPLDQIPVIIIIVRRQLLSDTGDEIGNHGINRDTGTVDQDTGLAGSAEIAFHAALFHFLVQRQGREHLADRTVGTNREQTQARTLLAVADLKLTAFRSSAAGASGSVSANASSSCTIA